MQPVSFLAFVNLFITGQYPRSVRSDKGGKYANNVWTIYSTEQGINHDISATYSLTLNAIAERANLTLAYMCEPGSPTKCMVNVYTMNKDEKDEKLSSYNYTLLLSLFVFLCFGHSLEHNWAFLKTSALTRSALCFLGYLPTVCIFDFIRFYMTYIHSGY
jgi:hypothetical protein